MSTGSALAARLPPSVLAGTRAHESAAAATVPVGFAALDEMLQGGLASAAVHEIYGAEAADASAATGLALAFALRLGAGRPLVWVRQDFCDVEAGEPYMPGLVEHGFSPEAITLVRARDAQGVLQAGLEAARCGALGVVMVELWGETRAFDLTASRRLVLAARASGVTVLMTRMASLPQPSGASSRWQVRAAPSRALAANAPGAPVFAVTLLRHRNGTSGRQWYLEWDRDRGYFADGNGVGSGIDRRERGPALSGAVVPVSFERPRTPDGTDGGGRGPSFRKAG